MNCSNPLTSVENELKRKVGETDTTRSGLATKASKTQQAIALKSVPRKMSREEAQASLSSATNDLKQNKKRILEKQKDIRALRTQLKVAEKTLSELKSSNDTLERQLRDFSYLAKSDIDRIRHRVFQNPHGLVDGVPFKIMEGICTLLANGQASPFEFLKLVADIGNSKNVAHYDLKMGALEWLNKKEMCNNVELEALSKLYTPVLTDSHLQSSSPCKIWPLIVRALEKRGSLQLEYWQFGLAVASKSQLMKKESSTNQYKSQSSFHDHCPILDLLHPTYEAMRSNNDPRATLTKTALKRLLLDALEVSTNTPSVHVDNRMPVEAAIAAKGGFKNIEKFLLSKTETILNLNLSKNGRMQVHRLIDNSMRYGVLKHQSGGTGRDRVLVIEKTIGPSPETLDIDQKRRAQHKKILQEMKLQE